MLMNPRVGQRVQVWYRERMRDGMPYHAHHGSVVVAARPRRRIAGVRQTGPINHGIELDDGPGALVVVPCGNLRGLPD